MTKAERETGTVHGLLLSLLLYQSLELGDVTSPKQNHTGIESNLFSAHHPIKPKDTNQCLKHSKLSSKDIVTIVICAWTL